MWKREKSWDRHTQAFTSENISLFSIFFFPSPVLITEIQPVLNCLSLLIKQIVIRGLPHLFHYRWLGEKLLIDSENFLWEFLLKEIRICQTKIIYFFCYSCKKHQIRFSLLILTYYFATFNEKLQYSNQHIVKLQTKFNTNNAFYFVQFCVSSTFYLELLRGIMY